MEVIGMEIGIKIQLFGNVVVLMVIIQVKPMMKLLELQNGILKHQHLDKDIGWLKVIDILQKKTNQKSINIYIIKIL